MMKDKRMYDYIEWMMLKYVKSGIMTPNLQKKVTQELQNWKLIPSSSKKYYNATTNIF